MHTNAWVVCLLASILPLAACHAPDAWSQAPEVGFADGFDNVAAETASNPLAGAFYGDGTGEVRARTENFFSRPLALDDITNGLQNNAARGMDEATAPAPKPAPEPAPADAPAPQPADRLLVYRGHVQVEVAKPEEAIAAFLAQVEEWHGYLQSQQGNVVTVRLPAAKFDEAFALLRRGGRVLDERREAADVTEEYVDLGIRLDNARKARERLLEVLKLADKVEDILKVEAELRRLTEEIERMEGRRKLLADQVAMATLQAGFTAVAAAPPGKRERRPSRFGWLNEIGAESMMARF